jgi:hypothetical protein
MQEDGAVPHLDRGDIQRPASLKVHSLADGDDAPQRSGCLIHARKLEQRRAERQLLVVSSRENPVACPTRTVRFLLVHSPVLGRGTWRWVVDVHEYLAAAADQCHEYAPGVAELGRFDASLRHPAGEAATRHGTAGRSSEDHETTEPRA